MSCVSSTLIRPFYLWQHTLKVIRKRERCSSKYSFTPFKTTNSLKYFTTLVSETEVPLIIRSSSHSHTRSHSSVPLGTVMGLVYQYQDCCMSKMLGLAVVDRVSYAGSGCEEGWAACDTVHWGQSEEVGESSAAWWGKKLSLSLMELAWRLQDPFSDSRRWKRHLAGVLNALQVSCFFNFQRVLVVGVCVATKPHSDASAEDAFCGASGEGVHGGYWSSYSLKFVEEEEGLMGFLGKWDGAWCVQETSSVMFTPRNLVLLTVDGKWEWGDGCGFSWSH